MTGERPFWREDGSGASCFRLVGFADKLQSDDAANEAHDKQTFAGDTASVPSAMP